MSLDLEDLKEPIQETDTQYSIIKTIGINTIQTFMGYVCLDIVFSISLHYVQVSYENQPEAANGVGLVFNIVYLILIPTAIGLNQSLNLHTAQALSMNRYSLSHSYLNITCYVHLIYYAPICVIIYLLKGPISLIIQDHPQQTIDYAWEYLIPFMVATYLAIQFESFKFYMLAHQVYTPFIVIHFISTILHVFWCKLFIIEFDYKLNGAGVAIILTECLNCLMLLIYFYWKQHYINGFSFEFQLHHRFPLVCAYLKSSVCLIFHVQIQNLVFYCLTWIATQLTTQELSAQIAFANTSQIFFRLPLSLSLVIMTYVSQDLGKSKLDNAKRYAIAGILIYLAFAIISNFSLWFMREQWAIYYWPHSSDIRRIMLEELPYFQLGHLIFNGLACTQAGILKGIDQAKIVFKATLISYYLVGLPVVCLLTYNYGLGLRLMGIWFGYGLANFLLIVFFTALIIGTNWELQAQLIKTKISQQSQLKEQETMDD